MGKIPAQRIRAAYDDDPYPFAGTQSQPAHWTEYALVELRFDQFHRVNGNTEAPTALAR